MTRRPIDTCYMCDDAKTSMEHAPPLCFFPEPSASGKKLRQNLVTVPSCDAHNSMKSKDDEFLRAIILLVSGASNEVASRHFHGKVLRGVRHSPHAHASFMTPLGRSMGAEALGRIDAERFARAISSIARALFFHVYGFKWKLPVQVVSPSLYAGAADRLFVPQTHLDAIEVTRAFLAGEPIRGENREVFLYRLRYDAEHQMYGLAMIFYEHFEVFCASSPAMLADVAPPGTQAAPPT